MFCSCASVDQKKAVSSSISDPSVFFENPPSSYMNSPYLSALEPKPLHISTTSPTNTVTPSTADVTCKKVRFSLDNFGCGCVGKSQGGTDTSDVCDVGIIEEPVGEQSTTKDSFVDSYKQIKVVLGAQAEDALEYVYATYDKCSSRVRKYVSEVLQTLPALAAEHAQYCRTLIQNLETLLMPYIQDSRDYISQQAKSIIDFVKDRVEEYDVKHKMTRQKSILFNKTASICTLVQEEFEEHIMLHVRDIASVAREQAKEKRQLIESHVRAYVDQLIQKARISADVAASYAQEVLTQENVQLVADKCIDTVIESIFEAGRRVNDIGRNMLVEAVFELRDVLDAFIENKPCTELRSSPMEARLIRY